MLCQTHFYIEMTPSIGWNTRKLTNERFSVMEEYQTYIPKPSSLGSVSTIHGGLLKFKKGNYDNSKSWSTNQDIHVYWLELVRSSYLFITKLIVPWAARLRRTSLASIAIPSGYMGMWLNLKPMINFQGKYFRYCIYLFRKPNSRLCASLKNSKSKCSCWISHWSELRVSNISHYLKNIWS